MMKFSRYFALLASLVFVVAVSAQTFVTPDDLSGWGFGFDSGSDGSLEFVEGPGTPPLGTGSAQFTINDGDTGVILGTLDYAGTRLDEITRLQYSTYRSAGSSAPTVALQFDMDYDLTDSTTDWQGRLVFEPYFDNTIVNDTWQTWDALAGRWWQTGTPRVGDAVVAQICPDSNPCDFATLLAAYPDAGIRATVGGVGFKAGSGNNWSGFVGNVSGFVFGIGGIDSTVSFDLTAPDADSPAGIPAFGSDGRINPDKAASVVAYGWQGGGVVFYSPAGVLLLAVTPEQIEAVGCPEVNTLVAEGNGVQLYRLSSCEFQMVAPTLDGTKNYNVLMTPSLALIRTFEE